MLGIVLAVVFAGLVAGVINAIAVKHQTGKWPWQPVAGDGKSVSSGSDCQYRHKSLPGVDGERTWSPWQQFSPDMEIRHPTNAAPAASGGEDSQPTRYGWNIK